MSSRSVSLLFLSLALLFGITGFMLDNWWAFAAAVVAAAVGGFAWTEVR